MRRRRHIWPRPLLDAPPGFAHPVSVEEMTSPDEIPETSYATRAKLTMGTPGDDEGWNEANERIRSLKTRRHLLVSNTGRSAKDTTTASNAGE